MTAASGAAPGWINLIGSSTKDMDQPLGIGNDATNGYYYFPTAGEFGVGGGRGAAVAKLTHDGDLVTVLTAGRSSATNRFRACHVDSSGNIIASGHGSNESANTQMILSAWNSSGTNLFHKAVGRNISG